MLEIKGEGNEEEKKMKPPRYGRVTIIFIRGRERKKNNGAERGGKILPTVKERTEYQHGSF